MKKLSIFLFTAIIGLIFGGCTLSKSFTPLSHEYLVSAIGFDEFDDEICVTIEAVVVNSEDPEVEKKNERLNGRGKSLDIAMKNAIAQASQPIELSHCAVVAIGKSVGEDYITEICKYIYNENEMTLSVNLISTENAEELLSSSTISSVSVGYDIVSMQQSFSRFWGVDFKNLFYEIEGKRESEINVFSLPFFEMNEDGYFISGITIFKNNSPQMVISEDMISAFSVATNSQSEGKVNIGGNLYDVTSVSSVSRLKNKDYPKLLLEINIAPELDKGFKLELKNEIISLFELSQSEKTDVFSLGNILNQKEPDFYNKFKKKYDKFYKNLTLEVVVK